MLVKARMIGKKVLLADGRSGYICDWGEPGKRGIRKASRRKALASGQPHLSVDIYSGSGYEIIWVPMDSIVKYIW